jgi:hypothetical protein
MQTDPNVRKYLFANLEKYEDNYYDVLDAKKWILATHTALYLMVGSADKGINPEYILSFSQRLQNNTSLVSVENGAGHHLIKRNAVSFYQQVSTFFKAPSRLPIVIANESFINNLVVINHYGTIQITENPDLFKEDVNSRFNSPGK